MIAATTSVPGLTFEAARHEYRWHGRRVPSVTQLLQGLGTFASIPPDVLAAACERGTYVHEMTEAFDLGELAEDQLPEPWHPYLAGWQRFVADSGARWSGIERLLYSPAHGYAGTSDRDGELTRWHPGVRWVIDVKTGRVPSKTWGLQTAAYRQALMERDSAFFSARRGTVQLTGNGRYQFLTWDSPEDWATFQALITLHHYGASA